jgi:hypothetical protein
MIAILFSEHSPTKILIANKQVLTQPSDMCTLRSAANLNNRHLTLIYYIQFSYLSILLSDITGNGADEQVLILT